MPDATITALLAKGILLGLGAAVPIGPINVEIARRTLHRGFRHGVALGGGASTADMAFAVIASVGWAPLIGNGALTYALGVAGVAFLLYLAAMCFRGLFTSLRAGGPDRFAVEAGTAGPRAHGSYLTGLLMNLLNPMVLAFWFVVLPGMAAKLTENPRNDLPWLCCGVFVGAFGWVLAFSGTLSIVGRFKRGLWVAATDAVGGLLLLGFALAAAWRMLRPILPLN